MYMIDPTMDSFFTSFDQIGFHIAVFHLRYHKTSRYHMHSGYVCVCVAWGDVICHICCALWSIIVWLVWLHIGPEMVAASNINPIKVLSAGTNWFTFFCTRWETNISYAIACSLEASSSIRWCMISMILHIFISPVSRTTQQNLLV